MFKHTMLHFSVICELKLNFESCTMYESESIQYIKKYNL